MLVHTYIRYDVIFHDVVDKYQNIINLDECLQNQCNFAQSNKHLNLYCFCKKKINIEPLRYKKKEL